MLNNYYMVMVIEVVAIVQGYDQFDTECPHLLSGTLPLIQIWFCWEKMIYLTVIPFTTLSTRMQLGKQHSLGDVTESA